MSSGWPPTSMMCGVAKALRKSPSAFGLPSGPRSLKSIERGVVHTVLPVFLSSADDVLHVTAVEVHDQQVAEDDRRRAGAAVVIALEVAPLPEHLAGARIDRRRAGRAEGDVDAAGLADRRRRGVAVERVRVLRLLDLEQLQVVDDLAARDVEGQGRQLASVGRRRRHPHLVADDDRRRPGAAVNRRLPADVALFTPGQRDLRAAGPCRARRGRGTGATARRRGSRRRHRTVKRTAIRVVLLVPMQKSLPRGPQSVVRGP